MVRQPNPGTNEPQSHTMTPYLDLLDHQLSVPPIETIEVIRRPWLLD